MAEINEIVSDAEIASSNEGINVSYYRPKFTHRVFANLIDILIFIFLFFSLFLGVREIIKISPTYKARNQELTQIKVDSGIYEYDDEGRVLTKVKISNEDEEERTLEEWTYDSYGNGYVDALFSEYYDRFGHILYGDELYYCYEQPE